MHSNTASSLLRADVSPADAQAAGNWAANLAALSITQPRLVEGIQSVPANLLWTFARDGFLTGVDAAGKWWMDCSVPLAAGRMLLKSLAAGEGSSCFIAPFHAAHIIAARERSPAGHAIIAVLPDLHVLRVMLSCADFSSEFIRHRLWFAWGDQWAAELDRLLGERTGLPTPTRFIRTPLVAEELARNIIEQSQIIFADHSKRRSMAVEEIRRSATPDRRTDRVLILAGSQFRLWENAGEILAAELSGTIAEQRQMTTRRFDCDDPLQQSPLALAEAALECGCVMTADIFRNEAAGLVPSHVPWITWVTRPILPPFDSAHPRDGLVLADPYWRTLASNSGWPAERIAVANWPLSSVTSIPASPAHLAILADTQPIVAPASVEDMSSQHVLWQDIAAELRENPLEVTEDITGFLSAKATRAGLSLDVLDHRAFVEKLILPAYQQGVARLLLQAGVPLRLHGRGWPEMPEFSAAAAGPVETPQALSDVASAATALVHVWPAIHSHPISSFGRPVLYRKGRRNDVLVREALALLKSPIAPLTSAPLSSLAATMIALAK